MRIKYAHYNRDSGWLMLLRWREQADGSGRESNGHVKELCQWQYYTSVRIIRCETRLRQACRPAPG
jgi:hypothetical protein